MWGICSRLAVEGYPVASSVRRVCCVALKERAARREATHPLCAAGGLENTLRGNTTEHINPKQ